MESTAYETLYEGIWVPSAKKLVKYNECTDIIRKKSNLAECIFPYTIRRLRGKSLIESIIPYIDQIQIDLLKLQQLKASLKPSGAVINIDVLANALEGANPIDDALSIYSQTGNIFIRQDPTLQGGQPPVTPIGDTHTLGQMQSLWQDIRSNLEFIRLTTGVTEQRDGTEVAARVATDVQKALLESSNNTTRHYEDVYVDLYKDMLSKLSYYIQEYIADDDTYFKNSLTQKTRDLIETTEHFRLADFGIFIDEPVDPSEEE